MTISELSHLADNWYNFRDIVSSSDSDVLSDCQSENNTLLRVSAL